MSLLPIFFAFILLAFIHSSTSLTSTFNFPSFTNAQNVKQFGDAFVNAEGYLDLTSTDKNKSITNSTGWAIYANPITLYDARTGFAADFQSNFSFDISPFNATCTGDGLTFFMAPVNWTYNVGNGGYGLGISTVNVSLDFQDLVFDATTFMTLVQYDSTTGNLTSTSMADPTYSFQYTSSKISNTNLTTVLPETVIVGFFASTGLCSEDQRVKSWSFSVTVPNQTPSPAPSLRSFSVTIPNQTPSPAPSLGSFPVTVPNPTPSPAPSPISDNVTPNWQQSSTGLQSKTVIVLVACLATLLILVLVIVIRFIRRRKNEKVELKEEEEEKEGTDDFAGMTMNFETGPKKFRYGELAAATNDFSEEGKLGQGGFGGVYRGIVRDTYEVVAVKRFSKGSSQGKKEYVAEVTVISRLRHRNLVRLIGWCHERGEFLLVYEYMEGGSLDSHLFSSKTYPVLPWAQRMKVVLGLASAVLYLHEEWEQCVVHRDIKLSNVMVDSEFNARLGDFGLARLTNHGFTARTTMLAGTMGYLAPECVITGKFSTRSDVYSFGVVLLEIATGRRAIHPIGEKEARLVEWTWEFYGLGSLMAAVDERLECEFDQLEMERMMVVGLWCVHPDPEKRPTIREAIRALSFQAKVPTLPQKMPMPFYAPLPTSEFGSLFTGSSSGTTGTSTTASSMQSAKVAQL